MRRFLSAAMFVATLMLAGCGPVATFDEPQPEGIRSLSAFPQRLQGRYQSEDGNSVLAITERLVTRHFDFEVREHRDSLGSSFKLSEDTLCNLEEGTTEIVIQDGDTVVSRVAWTDTLFSISENNILKRFKGYYFLNKRYRKDVWVVAKLAFSRGVLAIGNVSTPEDIQNLRAITEYPPDTDSTHFAPSRKQFRQFLRQDGFRDEELFFRIGK